jgi:hypothetical protein
MPSFNLTPDEVASFRPLPGHALLRCLPAELKDSPSSLIVKPESAASAELERAAVRRGEVIKISWANLNGSREQRRDFHNSTEHSWYLGQIGHFDEHGVWYIKPGTGVALYLGHLDESDNQYVVVKILQIVAVETPAARVV